MDQQCKTCDVQEGCTHEGHPDDRCMEELIRKDRLNKIGRKLLVMSGKGGVGKTSVSVNLSLALAMRGKKVGLLDKEHLNIWRQLLLLSDRALMQV